jgi:hypothetical protein
MLLQSRWTTKGKGVHPDRKQRGYLKPFYTALIIHVRGIMIQRNMPILRLDGITR